MTAGQAEVSIPIRHVNVLEVLAIKDRTTFTIKLSKVAIANH